MNTLSLPFIELQTSLYQRLSGSNELTSLVSGIYDYVTKDTPFPYIHIAEPTLSFEGVKASNVQELKVTLHAWYNQMESENYGNAEVYRMLNAIYKSLKAPLDVPGWNVVRTKVSNPKVFDDINDILKHGVITYSFTLQKTGE